ncbi:MAG: TlpA family protein disulfide reductase, partial [Bacteroidia bacterium]|nr:TlpA family protein disulfide reductase [Bacteroidia bacterium]
HAAYITADILNSDDPSAYFYVDSRAEEIKMAEGHLNTTIDINQANFIRVRLARQNLFCYITPGDSLNISFDKDDFENTLSFSGKHSKENDLLQKVRETVDEMSGSYRDLFSLTEADFIARLDSIKIALVEMRNEIKNSDMAIDPGFLSLLETDAHYEHTRRIESYENRYKRYTSDTTYVPSDQLADLIGAESYDNPEALGSPEFRGMVLSRMWDIADEYEEDGSEDGLQEATANELSHIFNDPDIQDYAKYASIKSALMFAGPEKTFGMAEAYLNNTTSAIRTKKLRQAMSRWEHLQKGKTAPDFEYPDIDSVMHALSDYKGKYVYLDVWATWCKPCIAQHPALHALEEKYHDNSDIVFMAVSVDEDAEAWKKMVIEKELGGIQLRAGKAPSVLDERYNISGIPRFVLIDKDGNILDSNAPRPSSDEMKNILKELLEPPADLLGYQE